MRPTKKRVALDKKMRATLALSGAEFERQGRGRGRAPCSLFVAELDLDDAAELRVHDRDQLVIAAVLALLLIGADGATAQAHERLVLDQPIVLLLAQLDRACAHGCP